MLPGMGRVCEKSSVIGIPQTFSISGHIVGHNVGRIPFTLWGASLNELGKPLTFMVAIIKHTKKVNFGPISKRFIFLKWEWKTWLNGLTKCPKFEEKIKR